MQNLFYKWSVDSRSLYWDKDLEDIVSAVERYNLLNEIKDGEDGRYVIIGDEPYFFKSKNGEKTVYDMFIDNMHIHMSVGKEERVYSIRLKRQEEKWDFNKGTGGKWDVSHPITETFEVYVWYDIPILDITRTVDFRYKHGSWDKYLFKTFRTFTQKIKEMTIDYQFDENYKKKLKTT